MSNELASFESENWSSNDSIGARDNDVEQPATSFEEHLASLENPASEDASSESSADVSETQENQSGQTVSAPDIEDVFVTAEDGKRQKISVNYADREAIKRAHQQAAGFRKFQAERDNLKRELESKNAKLAEIEPHWSKLDEIYQRQGPEAVIDLLMGQPGAFDALVSKRMERETLRTKNADEAYRLDEAEKRAADRREREWQDQQNKKLMEGYEEKLQRANEKEAYAMLTPSFQKYSVAGKMGDSIAESRIDNAIWAQTVEVLEKMDENLITQEVVDREFRKVASSFTRGLQKAGKEVVKQQVAAQKSATAQKVAARATSGMQQVNTDADLRKELWKSGSSANVLAKLLGGGRK